MAGTARCSQRLWRKPNSLNDGLGEKNANPIDLSSDDSATSVHVAQVTGSDAGSGSLPKIETMPTLKPIFNLIEIPLSNENVYVIGATVHKAVLTII